MIIRALRRLFARKRPTPLTQEDIHDLVQGTLDDLKGRGLTFAEVARELEESSRDRKNGEKRH